MDIRGNRVLILGGSGLVGSAVARRLLEHRPASIVLSALRRGEAEAAIVELEESGLVQEGTELASEYGDVFLPEALKDRPRAEILDDDDARALLLDDLFGELGDPLVRRSALGSLLLRIRPDIVIDCINTATAFAYQNVFDSALGLRERAAAGGADVEAVERHLATLYLPQLIRHVQIALEGMRAAGTRFYLKIGTAGTGGMGLNIPFTHSEERPSRVLLSKAGVAGAHTLYLYLMARTPGAPAVKEIKPTAAVSWRRITFGEVRRRGEPIQRYDASRALPVDQAFQPGAEDAYAPSGGALEGVYLDAGENGLFSSAEFEALTALGLMEYITPEEIADDVIRELTGHPTGHDVIGALDAATSGPTYRAGVMREVALARMEELEARWGVEPVAYEMLGPPRLSKLLFEAAILNRIFGSLQQIAELDATQTAAASQELLERDEELRIRILTIGFPILLPDGRELLRGAEVRVAPRGASADIDRLADQGWIDLRAENWRRWAERAERMLGERNSLEDADRGSAVDTDPGTSRGRLRPGRLAAWVLRSEDGGLRIKR